MNLFESPAVKVEIRNLTTDRLFPDFPFIEIIEIGDGAIDLSAPVGHAEIDDHILVQVSFQGKRAVATARVVMLDDTLDPDGNECRIGLLFLGYDPTDWKNILAHLDHKQAFVDAVFTQTHADLKDVPPC